MSVFSLSPREASTCTGPGFSSPFCSVSATHWIGSLGEERLQECSKIIYLTTIFILRIFAGTGEKHKEKFYFFSVGGGKRKLPCKFMR